MLPRKGEGERKGGEGKRKRPAITDNMGIPWLAPGHLEVDLWAESVMSP